MMSAVENVAVPCADGAVPYSILRPTRLPAPAVLLVSTIFGVDSELQATMTDYTRLGFITVAPDLFWRILSGPLDHRLPSDYERATGRYDAFDLECGMRDLGCVVKALDGVPGYSGKYGIIGFCFGGRYAFLAAARLGASVAVSFHGSNVEGSLNEADAVRCPISLHYGDADPLAPMAEIERIRLALQHNPDAEICIYAGAGHGYTSPTKPSYDEDATIKSHERARELLLEHLKVIA